MINKYLYNNCLFVLFIVFMMNSCGETMEDEVKTKEIDKTDKTSLTVTATAYNSFESQTKKGNVGLAAWGDTLLPGDCAIAVSRDLIKQGLDHNTEVEIEGMPGTYKVKDKMNKRWQNKIDIYMGLNQKAAREWGKQQVEIYFEEEQEIVKQP